MPSAKHTTKYDMQIAGMIFYMCSNHKTISSYFCLVNKTKIGYNCSIYFGGML